MSKPTHTPGPWKWRKDTCPGEGQDYDGITGGDGAVVAYVAEGANYDGSSCDPATIIIGNDADARLIAAAPDLLAALKGVMRFALPITNHDVADFNAARAAIAAAEGEE